MEIGSLGVPELLIILVVVLLLFGPRRLPEVSRGLGKAVRNFRKELEGGIEELREPGRADPGAEAAAPAEDAAGGSSAEHDRDPPTHAT